MRKLRLFTIDEPVEAGKCIPDWMPVRIIHFFEEQQEGRAASSSQVYVPGNEKSDAHHLFAAAPDLLAALVELLDCQRYDIHRNDPRMVAAEATATRAIAKAKGGAA